MQSLCFWLSLGPQFNQRPSDFIRVQMIVSFTAYGQKHWTLIYAEKNDLAQSNYPLGSTKSSKTSKGKIFSRRDAEITEED